MAFKKIKFAYEHPTFGRSNKQKQSEPFKNSVYYLWWEFLRRNAEYKKCCISKGKGKLKNLYSDFGDIHAVDFKTWWQADDRGAYLFGEKPLPEFSVVSAGEVDESEGVIFIQVPMSLPKRFLTQQFQKILNTHHSGRRGIRTNRDSSAKYPVTGHVDILALQKCLMVYDMKQKNTKMTLWQIAQECKVTSVKQFVKNDGSESKTEISDKKLVLANTARRLLNRAESIIEGTSKGLFPVSDSKAK